jgi:hypothetical protein
VNWGSRHTAGTRARRHYSRKHAGELYQGEEFDERKSFIQQEESRVPSYAKRSLARASLNCAYPCALFVNTSALQYTWDGRGSPPSDPGHISAESLKPRSIIVEVYLRITRLLSLSCCSLGPAIVMHACACVLDRCLRHREHVGQAWPSARRRHAHPPCNMHHGNEDEATSRYIDSAAGRIVRWQANNPKEVDSSRIKK